MIELTRVCKLLGLVLLEWFWLITLNRGMMFLLILMCFLFHILAMMMEATFLITSTTQSNFINMLHT